MVKASSIAALLRGGQGQRRGDGLGDLGRRRCIGQVEIGKGDRTTVGQRRAFGDAHRDIDDRDDRGIVGAGDGDRHILGIGAAVAVIDGDGVDDRDRLAGGEEVELGLGDGVIPVDGAVVGVAGIRTDGEGILDRGLLCGRQGQRRGHRLGDLTRRRRIGQVEIGKGDRTGIIQRDPSVMAPATSTTAMTGASLAPVMVTVTSWVSVPPLASSTVMV